jgi:hypothetical protein
MGGVINKINNGVIMASKAISEIMASSLIIEGSEKA